MKDYNFELFMETSAKTGLNAEELFVQAAKILYKNYLMYNTLDSQENLGIRKKLKSNNTIIKRKKKVCC